MNSNAKRKPMTELAKRNQPTPEQKKDWDEMAEALVNNLNKNVRKEHETKRKPMTELAKKLQPTPEGKKWTDAMVDAMAENLNRNVREDDKAKQAKATNVFELASQEYDSYVDKLLIEVRYYDNVVAKHEVGHNLQMHGFQVLLKELRRKRNEAWASYKKALDELVPGGA